MAVRAICAAITIAAISTAAKGQPSDAYHACAIEKDPAARLACFDRVDSARFPASSTPADGSSASDLRSGAPPASRAADPDIGLDARQARRQRAERGEAEPAQSAAIVATVVRVIPRSPLICAFVLSNGQVWEQAESMKFTAEPQQTVTIRSGLLGAFFLKNAAGRTVRVHRIQ